MLECLQLRLMWACVRRPKGSTQHAEQGRVQPSTSAAEHRAPTLAIHLEWALNGAGGSQAHAGLRRRSRAPDPREKAKGGKGERGRRPPCGPVASERASRDGTFRRRLRNTIDGSETGTIFEDSPLGLDKWLMAMWQVVNCKNGVSSYEVHRAIGISQKSAWFMDHRIRHALTLGTINKLYGQIEADETYIGAKARNMHPAKRAVKITGTAGKDKIAVMGILERGSKATGSRVRTKIVDNTRKKVLQSEIREHVKVADDQTCAN